MRNLVKRYVAAMIRDAKTEEGLTEENFKVTALILDGLIAIYQNDAELQLKICLRYFPLGVENS